MPCCSPEGMRINVWGGEGRRESRSYASPHQWCPCRETMQCEALAKWILLSGDISAYQCNLVCDPGNCTCVGPLHSSPLGIPGQESMLDGDPFPPFQWRPRIRVMCPHNQPVVWLMIPAFGAIDNSRCLYTKAVCLVTLAPVWEHLAVLGVKLWVYACRTCLPQTLYCLGVKDESYFKSLGFFLSFFFSFKGGRGCQHSQLVIGHILMSRFLSSSRFISTLLLMYHCFLCPLCLKLIIVYHN